MKTIKVQFPDGVRDWPAEEYFEQSTEMNGPTSARVRPEPHPDWRFKAMIGGWRASPSDNDLREVLAAIL